MPSSKSTISLGEDILRTGAGTQYIGIVAQDPTLTYISLRQDGTLSHYSQPFPLDDVIDPKTHNVLRDARGLVEWLGCYGRKSFYCSEPALLNDDDDDEEETL